MRRVIFATLAVVGMACRAGAVEFGWQTVGGGGIEYIVQVEPELIDSFRREGFTSEVPAGLRDIRRIRIAVGSEKLPNQGDLIGPTVAQAGPVKEEPKPANDLPPSPPETFGQAEQKPAAAQAEAAVSQSGKAPPLLDSSRPVPPLPFFQSGPAKSIASNPVAANEKTPRPAIVPTEERKLDRQVVEAGMPASPGADGEADAGVNRLSRAAAKPWGILLAAVLGLFASLGANVYLVWIHQDVRAKYRALAGQMHGGASAA